MIRTCKPVLIPAHTPSGKTLSDPQGWTDALSGGSVLVPVGYDEDYIEYTSYMYYAVSLAASTAYTFHGNCYGGAPITLYNAAGTQVASADVEYDEQTGDYTAPDLVYTPSAAGIFIARFGVNDMAGMGEPYTATISPTPATHSRIVPAHAGAMKTLDDWGYPVRFRDTAAANVGWTYGCLCYEDGGSLSFDSFSGAAEAFVRTGGPILTDVLDHKNGNLTQISHGADNSSVHMWGQVYLPSSGTWKLCAKHDDYLCARLGNQTGSDNQYTGSVTEIVSYTASAAGWTDIEIYWQNSSGDRYYTLYLQGPNDSAPAELTTAQVRGKI